MSHIFSRVYTTNDRRPGSINLRAGTLDISKDMTPHFHIWVRSKQPWITIPTGTPAFDTRLAKAAVADTTNLMRLCPSPIDADKVAQRGHRYWYLRHSHTMRHYFDIRDAAATESGIGG